MKRIQSTLGVKRRFAFAAIAALAAAAVAAPVAFAASSPVLGFGDNTVVVADELEADSKFSAASGDASAASALSTPAKRSEIVVKKETPAAASSDSAASTAATADGWHSGLASHYGIDDGFMGGTCADGSIVTETSMGVAMRSVPLGTKVEISYNGRTVVATVVDRGPYHGNRVIDLQPAVARALGTVEAGVVTVQYRFL